MKLLEEHAIIEEKGHILIIRLNRPEKKNALSPNMLMKVYDAWRKLDENNHLHLYLNIKTKQIGDKIELLNKSISFLYDEELYKNKMKKIENRGIPMIKNNIYDVSQLGNIFIP